MKIETFGEIAPKIACPEKFFLIFNLIFRKRCSAEKEVFSRFFQFRLLDQLDTAYCASPERSSLSGKVAGSHRFVQRSPKCCFE